MSDSNDDILFNDALVKETDPDKIAEDLRVRFAEKLKNGLHPFIGETVGPQLFNSVGRITKEMINSEMNRTMEGLKESGMIRDYKNEVGAKSQWEWMNWKEKFLWILFDKYLKRWKMSLIASYEKAALAARQQIIDALPESDDELDSFDTYHFKQEWLPYWLREDPKRVIEVRYNLLLNTPTDHIKIDLNIDELDAQSDA